MTTQKVLGIMSGTSLDGVDYALCEISSSTIKLKKLWSVDYPAELRKKLLAAATDKLSSYRLSQLHHDLGRFYAAKAPSVKCNYIGLHGQTIFHNPSKNGATFQMGEPAYLAARFNVPVINQFRTMDLALGGQGAPLATLFHKHVFGRRGLNVAVNNLGGISNVTYLPKNGKILSFDTGPANILIDAAMKKLTGGKLNRDEGGAFAGRGVGYRGIVAKWLNHPFFSKRPPKSTGREEFGEKFLTKALADCRRARLDKYSTIATLTEFTAHSIALNYEKFLPQWPDVVVLCGGGSHNPTLVKAVRRALRENQWVEGLDHKSKNFKPIDVVTSDDWDWPSQAIEAAAFALLAFHTMTQKPGNIPQTTGARRAAVLGQITPAP